MDVAAAALNILMSALMELYPNPEKKYLTSAGS